MRIDGHWQLCSDGFERPVLEVQLRLSNGQRVPELMLLDTGADFTLLSYSCAQTLSDHIHPQFSSAASGVGGDVQLVLINVDVVLTTIEGQEVALRGPIQAPAGPSTLDLSVLGRDVLDYFSLVYSRPNELIALITPPDTLTIS